MAVFKNAALLCLAILVSSAEATNFSDPVICYVLDAILLFYCIIFTALYFKLKFEKARTFAMVPNKSAGMDQAAPEEGQYEALVGQRNDEYQEIQRKTKPRNKKNKVKEAKSDAAEAIEMKPAPLLPARE
ncbi:CD247 antigen like [Clarias gariepinus]|uniref:CD247 antigen like n=1 Tax=Clarias gariepinus TaxID=13013 RepID=UPI00234D2AB5|nr:CD247 antigen like [Clarias gariepinus]